VTSPLRILLLEDSFEDAELIAALLEADDVVCQVERVQTRDEFLAGLGNNELDLILADYRLPAFDGISALKLAVAARPDLPFIIVSGAAGEELAVEALKLGATDYILKTRLSRLAPSVRRAVRERQERSERKRAEGALLRSEMYLAEAQRLSLTGSFGWNLSGGEIYWSDETYRIFECDRSTRPTLQLMIERTHPDDQAHLQQIIERSSAAQGEFAVEYRLLRTDGSVKHVRAVAHVVSGEGPENISFVGAITDITERKRAEETLREQANLLNLTHDAIFVRNMNGLITYWNRGAEALYGWTAQEALGELAPRLLKTTFSTPLERIRSDLLSLGRWEGELVRDRKDGTRVTVGARWSLQRVSDKAPVAILETNNDITERKRAEEAVRRSERQLRDVIETTPAMVFSTLADGSTEFVNQRWLAFTGLPTEGPGRSDWQSTVHPDDLSSHVGKWRKALATGEPFENEVRHRGVDGAYRWFLVRAVPTRDEFGHVAKWYGTLTDIQGRKRAEEALRASEEQWKAVFENNPTMYFMVDAAGSIVSVNPFGAEQLGYSIGELMGRPMQSLFHEADRQAVGRYMTLCLAHPGRAISWELRKIRKDGEVLWVRETARAMLTDDRSMILVVCEDITERMRATEALREAQTELAHANRLATMGQLTASIAHEVSQPVAAAVTNAETAMLWLDHRPPNVEEARQALGRILRDGNRAADVIGRIRALIRKAPPRQDRVDINGAIREVIELTRGEVAKNGVSLQTQLAKSLPLIGGDRVQLQQVVLNLIINAAQAMGTLTNGVRELVIVTSEAGPQVVLVAVKDSGPGLTPESAEHIFDPFYSTKPGGLGMGLSICRSIIEAHGGRLWAGPNEPQGAVFQFILPTGDELP
jgi:PAS domain S-box-containing protein